MKVTYTSGQLEEAMGDLLEVYEAAEERLSGSCIGRELIQARNAFQVFRYAFREWALDKSTGVVLRALMLAENAGGEVSCNLKTSPAEEMVIQCDDEIAAEVISLILETHGYEEEGV
jgi:hypothetical protein